LPPVSSMAVFIYSEAEEDISDSIEFIKSISLCYKNIV